MSDARERLSSALSDRYSIERELGQGGMATVYLAQDLKHNRPVALKVLKPELSAVVGAERFLAEIETTAGLQHPHILPLFDSGEADGLLFYVMPYVEGETLRERLDREKQLPVDEGVRIATAIASALDSAHRRGVIHRDIKPGNILLQDGQPVVADFGIALAVGAAGGNRLTETGLSVGTPYYMSPEQATGDQVVGPASDTYALGCVLYEMLVGEPPYLGNTAQAVLGKIIQGVPVSATSMRRSIPHHVDAAIRKALEKLPADRFASAQDFAHALTDPSFRHGDSVAVGGGRLGPASLAGWGLAAVLAGALVWTSTRPAPPRSVGRFAIATEEGTAFTGFAHILGDGSGMIYLAPGPSGAPMLWIRRWDETTGTPIRGTEQADGSRVTVSPDGREVLFSAGFPGPLRVAPLLGGTVRTIAEAAYGGGVWTADGGAVYFCDGDIGISRVSATGGEVTQLVDRPDSNFVPFALIDGDRTLLLRRYATATAEDSDVQALRLDSRERITLLEGSSPIAVTESGHLVFGTTDGALMAAPFDERALEVTAVPTLMVDGVGVNTQLHAMATVSRDGSLLYLPGGTLEVQPVWVDRTGRTQVVDPDWRFRGAVHSTPALSPDGRRAVVTAFDNAWDLWLKELDEGPETRFTFAGAINRRASWSEDGGTVYFYSNRRGQGDLWSRPSDGSRDAALVFDRAEPVLEAFLAPGAEWVVFRTGSGSTADIFAVRVGGDTAAVPLATTGGADVAPAVSPDGRWLAYASNQNGPFEIFVTSFPTPEARHQVSVGGGTAPVWSRTGDELFYRSPTHYVAASVATGASFQVRGRTELFPVGQFITSNAHPVYDVHPDGRFLMLLPGEREEAPLVLVQNWTAEVDERLGR